MDPLEPWIDASAVRRMAERLLEASDEPEVDPGPDAGFGSDAVKINVEQIFKLLSPGTEVKAL